MALSATFTANFTSFYDAVDKAQVALKDMGADAAKAQTKLNAMADSFSGRKIIQDATLMVAAIGDIENISKLTEKEMARLGATTNEAVAKMKALGLDVPEKLQAVADKTKAAEKQTTDWKGSLIGLAGAMGIAFSVDAIVGFGKEIFNLAGQIKDLSGQWGVSIEAVQRFTKAAEAGGASGASVGKALQFLSGELAGTDALFTAIIKKLGMTKEELRALPLEEAFLKVTDALAGIENATERQAIAIKLLGPAAKEMIGPITEGFREATKETDIFAKETVLRLAEAQSAWKRLTDSVVIYSGEMMVGVMKGLESMGSSWGTFFKFVGLSVKDALSGSTTAGAFLQFQNNLKDIDKQTKTVTTSMGANTKAAGALGGSYLSLALIEADVEKKTKALKAAEDARTKALADAKAKQEAFRKEVEAQQKAVTDLSRALSGDGLIQQAIKYLSALETSIPVQQMTAKAQAEINKVMADAIDVYVRAGQEIPKTMLDTWVATKIASDRVVDFNFSLEELKKRYLDLTQLPKFDPFSLGTSVPLPDAPEEDRLPGLIKNIRTISQELGQLGTVAGGTFGEVLTAAADIGWAFDQATLSAKGLKTGIGELNAGNTTKGLTDIAAAGLQAASSFMAVTAGAGMMESIIAGASMGAGIGAMFVGIGAGAGAAAGAVVGMFRGFANAQAASDEVSRLRGEMLASIPSTMDLRKEIEASGYALERFANADTVEELKAEWDRLTSAIEANKLRDAYIETAGGVDELRKAAELAGVNIDKLMAASGKPLQEEIAALNEAFQFQEESMQTLIETAERYGFTLAELGPAMQAQELDKQAQQLFKDWQVLNAAGIDTIDITKRMGESVSEYVQSAMQMGFEVPEAMRPMLEAMAQAGTLTDANGDAITDLEKSGVSFALTMSDGFKRLIDVVEKLTDSISRSLGIAIKNVPDVQVKGTVKWDVGDPSTTSQKGSSLEEFAKGSDGFRNFGSGTPVMLHGWEAVVPKDDAASMATIAAPSMAGAGGGGVAPVVNVYANGAFFDTPDSLQRLATKVSDALTAKYSVMGKLRAAV